ncbi:MAG: hypothetical protein BMS9Abin22_087 [Gammaproteobacteria bacterium]|nr:MAG: hypothetical protein BMS9Abin22_087 [Gammaproteobacteria bacterium]
MRRTSEAIEKTLNGIVLQKLVEGFTGIACLCQ